MKITYTSIRQKKHSYGWISAAGIIVLMVIGMVAQAPVSRDSLRHGAYEEEAGFELLAYAYGSTLELQWEEQPGLPLYRVYYAETNPYLDEENSTLLTETYSTSLVLTPYRSGYYRVFAQHPSGTTGSTFFHLER